MIKHHINHVKVTQMAEKTTAKSNRRGQRSNTQQRTQDVSKLQLWTPMHILVALNVYLIDYFNVIVSKMLVRWGVWEHDNLETSDLDSLCKIL